jgi:ribosomal protein S18 acetylase RimI-like enzyme
MKDSTTESGMENESLTEAPDPLVSSVRDFIARKGTSELLVDELKPDDLQSIGWSGTPSHVRSVRDALDRVGFGEVEYLAVRAPDGRPVSKGGIDYAAHQGAGTFWQLATHPDLQGLGLGTRLIEEGERRIRNRGVEWAVVGVEPSNPRARALYERLGYEPFGREHASWTTEDQRGRLVPYETEVELLRKRLSA